mgnify:CR=1 FL=1
MFEIKPVKKGGLSKKDYFTNFLDMFDEDFNPVKLFGSSFKVDIRDTEKEYLIEADLPGFDKDAITIVYDNNNLTITAKREESVKEEKENYVRQERSFGEVKRQFHVVNVDEEKIDAKFDNGVLKLVLPKKEVAEKKAITIK